MTPRFDPGARTLFGAPFERLADTEYQMQKDEAVVKDLVEVGDPLTDAAALRIYDLRNEIERNLEFRRQFDKAEVPRGAFLGIAFLAVFVSMFATFKVDPVPAIGLASMFLAGWCYRRSQKT